MNHHLVISTKPNNLFIKACVESQGGLCGSSGNGTHFSPSISVFLCRVSFHQYTTFIHSFNAWTWWNRPISSCSAKKFVLAYHNNNKKNIYNTQGTYFSEGKTLILGKQTTHTMGLSNDDDETIIINTGYYWYCTIAAAVTAAAATTTNTTTFTQTQWLSLQTQKQSLSHVSTHMHVRTLVHMHAHLSTVINTFLNYI